MKSFTDIFVDESSGTDYLYISPDFSNRQKMFGTGFLVF